MKRVDTVPVDGTSAWHLDLRYERELCGGVAMAIVVRGDGPVIAAAAGSYGERYEIDDQAVRQALEAHPRPEIVWLDNGRLEPDLDGLPFALRRPCPGRMLGRIECAWRRLDDFLRDPTPVEDIAHLRRCLAVFVETELEAAHA